ncbi:MAG TPA: tetratricopeptide repeat protein [Pirellulales bacterium]|nr:tetratricopeptide repeat protein [Pirellulales bacterium]
MLTTRFTVVGVAALALAGSLPQVSFAQAVLAQAYLDSAAAARDAGNTAKAARLYALALTEAHGQQHAYLTAKALLGAATIHLETSDFDQAEENVRAALALCDGLQTPPAAELATALNCMAIVSYHRQEYEQAESCYAELLGGLTSDEDAVLRGIVMNDLALVKIALDEPQEAIELAQSAAEIMSASFGNASAHYAQCLDTLAQALVADGRPDEAETIVAQALEICAADIGDDSPQYGTTLLTLAKAQHLRGEHALAVNTAERSVGLQENTRGADHPLTNLAESELAAMREAHVAQTAANRPAPDEWKRFDEMYAELGLAPAELSALRDHWLSLTGPQRLEHYQNFRAEVAAQRAGSAVAPLADRRRVDAAEDGAEGELKDDEAMFHDLFGRHNLPPEELKQHREEWQKLTPDERQAAANLFRRSLRTEQVP